MKHLFRILSIIICVLYVLVTAGCSQSTNKQLSSYIDYVGDVDCITKQEEMRAVWISYFEYDIKNLSKMQFCENINRIFDNVKSLGLNTVIIHTRANADAIYDSKFFPWSDIITGQQGKNPGYDPLEYMVSAARSRGLKIHAWINPYRISNTSDDVSKLHAEHIAVKWRSDPKTADNVISYGGKLYFNPAVAEVRTLILNGIKEITENYDVDGIHLDDYFYPTNDPAFDLTSYEEYKKSCASPLSLSSWRTTNISALISAIKRITKEKGILFGVSPSAHIDGDYLSKNGYADIKNWIKSDAYIDYILPQIYWGFEYPDPEYQFEKMFRKWKSLSRNKSVALYIGLAAYKIGSQDLNDEWRKNNDIISRQLKFLSDEGCDGFSIFSYSHLFSSESAKVEERNKIENFLKTNN